MTTSSDLKELSKTMKCRQIANWWMIVISTICGVKIHICYSHTNDSKCLHRSSCTLTSSQPVTTRTDTSPLCCPVWSCHAFQPFRLNCGSSMHHTRKRETQLRFFHAPHEKESDLGPFQGLLDSIPRKREEVPLRRITPQEHFWDRERLSIYVCLPILSQETGGW